MVHPASRYITDEYLDKNPTWDIEDSGWKAIRVEAMLTKAKIYPKTICEVGCGAGRILEILARHYTQSQFAGYDIAPAAAQFWEKIDSTRVKLTVGDFFEIDSKHYDLLLLLDVLEHVADPNDFLIRLKGKSDHIVIHFPLDLSALNVMRESPLLYVRRKVGHIHYFTKAIALELLDECGFEVIDCQYTGAAISSPQATLKTRLARLPRQFLAWFNKDLAVRLLGGETLMVLAKPK